MDTQFDINSPPSGAFFEGNEDRFIVGATTRSMAALFLAPLVLIISVIPVVVIFGSQLNGRFNVILSLTGALLILIGLYISYYMMLAICGRVTLTIADGQATIFKGFGPVGFRRHFDWKRIERVLHGEHEDKSDLHYALFLESADHQALEFAGELSMERRRFCYHAIKEMLLQK